MCFLRPEYRPQRGAVSRHSSLTYKHQPRRGTLPSLRRYQNVHKDSAQLTPVSRSLRSLLRTTQHHLICEIRALSDAQRATSTMTPTTALSCHRNPPPADVAPGRKCSKPLRAQHSIPVDVRTDIRRERRADSCDFDGLSLTHFLACRPRHEPAVSRTASARKIAYVPRQVLDRVHRAVDRGCDDPWTGQEEYDQSAALVCWLRGHHNGRVNEPT